MPKHLQPYLIDWPPQDSVDKKELFETTHRVCSFEKTLQRIDPLRKAAGITRVSDITALDCIGIPVFAAVRPEADLYDENITVYNGKGLTSLQAKVSALMEAFERDGGERRDRPALLESYHGIQRYGPGVHPADLILPDQVHYHKNENLEWVPGRDLISGEVWYVPAAAVFFPYRPRRSARFFERFSDTNGLASGNTILEATAYALSEVIERDTETSSFFAGRGNFIDLRSFDHPVIQKLLQKFQEVGIHVYLKEITSKLQIPSFTAAIDDSNTENPILLSRGIGTHVNAEIAVIRALTEAAQSRCAFISGHREDLIQNDYRRRGDYQALKEEMHYWYDDVSPRKDFQTIPILKTPTLLDDILTMVTTLKRNGFKRIIAVNLTQSEVGIPVARVIVPGLVSLLDSSRTKRRRKILGRFFI
jgi:putative methanogenesis marker protein 1